MAKTPEPHADGFCYCGSPRAAHIGDLPCLRAAQGPKPRGLYDLPIFGRIWQADGRDLQG